MDQMVVQNICSVVAVLIANEKTENYLESNMIDKYIDHVVNVFGLRCSKEERNEARRSLEYRYYIKAEPGKSILGDYEQENWYTEKKNTIDQFFWARYKSYLIDEMGFGPNVVATLEQDTLDLKLMNYILDPNKEYDSPQIHRGLVIGDVQSGKTSTYIAFMCKAADAGYKVFILLSGTTENLRSQTQKRVEEGFIGLDNSGKKTIGTRVGVGLDNKPLRAISLTTRTKDFNGDKDQTVLPFSQIKDAVVFVIKKNSMVLRKLKRWLENNNVDTRTGKIDMPLLLIDDEADNASINTRDKEDPTVINELIRNIANLFTISNYVGFTATPYANVFIDPDRDETMETQDLFPEDFIVSLPKASNYIGPEEVFGQDGKYKNQIIYIKDAGREPEDGFSFYYKHEKTWDDDLPESLTDAVYAFYIVNAIRDLRGDKNDHRTMMINITRFIDVQKRIKEKIEHIHKDAYIAIKYNLSTDSESLNDPVLYRIHKVWQNYFPNIGFVWEDIAGILFKSCENIQIKVVNSSKDSEKLTYPKNESRRIIAIGGLALSRGLTLEGLIISYFYRNTITYDVLMQMGRWFGYRKGYEDLFRIWIEKSSANWYGDIADATRRLKDDMDQMYKEKKKPSEFGIRIRNDYSDLQITAYNKMRNATDEYVYNNYFGTITETPYLKYDPDAHRTNFEAVQDLVRRWKDKGNCFTRENQPIGKERYILQNVSKNEILRLLDKLIISDYNRYFDKTYIKDFITATTDSSLDHFDVAFMEGADKEDVPFIDFEGAKIRLVQRKNCSIERDKDLLSIGRKGKLGGTRDGVAGLRDFGNSRVVEIYENALLSLKNDLAIKGAKYESLDELPVSSNTWFKYIKERNPLVLIYFLDVGCEDEGNQQKQFDELKTNLNGVPVVGFAMGFPRNDLINYKYFQKYKVNKAYNYFNMDTEVGEDE